MDNPNPTERIIYADNEPDQIPLQVLAARSFIFYLGYTAATLIHSPLCILFGPFMPFKKRYRFINQWSRFTIWWLKVTCDITYSISGYHNIPSQPGGIIVSKHQSQWETFFLQRLFEPQATVLKRELIWVPLFGWALSLLRPIVINRANKRAALKQIIQQGKQRMAEGSWILIFPEGTRVPTGQDSKLSKGAFILASETGYPIIPVVHNSGHCWKPHQIIKYPGHISIEIGPPVESHDVSVDTLMHTTRNWMEKRMHQISEVEAINKTHITIPSDQRR